MLLASRAEFQQLFALFPAVSVTWDNLLPTPMSILHPVTEHQIPTTHFASTLHPSLSIFILDSITFWFQQRLALYYIALRCVSLPHRFMSELKDGCPIFCLDSSAGGIVCVLKALCRTRVKDVWTIQPCNSSDHWPFLSHPAIRLCIAVICRVSSFSQM